MVVPKGKSEKVIRLHLLWTEWFFNNLGDPLLRCFCLHQSGGLTNPLQISTGIWNKFLVTMDNPHCEQFSWALSLSSHVHTEICGLFWVTRTYLWKATYVDFYNLLFMALNSTHLHCIRVEQLFQNCDHIKQNSAYTTKGKWENKYIFVICMNRQFKSRVWVATHENSWCEKMGREKKLIRATRTNCPTYNKVTLRSCRHSCNITALSH